MKEIHTGAKNAKPKPGPWNDQENRALVALYFTMLDLATAGKQYNKAAMIRAAIAGMAPRELNTMYANESFLGKLPNRSRGSIEAKLMNASAAHRDLVPGAETMATHGYKAWGNYQATLKAEMASIIDRRELAADHSELPTGGHYAAAD